MEQLPEWVMERNSNPDVKPLTTFDFGARLIDNANNANYPKTPEIIKHYTNLASSLLALTDVQLAGCSEDEIKNNKKAVYNSYNELVNEIQNYLNSHDDEEARFHYKELVMHFGKYRKYA